MTHMEGSAPRADFVFKSKGKAFFSLFFFIFWRGCMNAYPLTAGLRIKAPPPDPLWPSSLNLHPLLYPALERQPVRTIDYTAKT